MRLASRPFAIPVQRRNSHLLRLRLLARVRPDAAEARENPRSRSAIMRVAERLAQPQAGGEGA